MLPLEAATMGEAGEGITLTPGWLLLAMLWPAGERVLEATERLSCWGFVSSTIGEAREKS